MRGSDWLDAAAPELGAAPDDEAPPAPELPLELPCDGAGVELPEDPLPPPLDPLPLCGLASGSEYWLSPAL